MLCLKCKQRISEAEQKVMGVLKFDKCVKCRKKLEDEKNRIEVTSQRKYDRKYPQQFGRVDLDKSGDSK